jgi:SAM-dependent methyltransferase
LDILPVHVNQAVRNGVQAFAANLNERLPFPDSSFDIVVANEVIDFLVNTDGFVKEMHRVLKTRGCAIISTTNIASWHSVILLALGRQPPAIPVSNEVPTTSWDERAGVTAEVRARDYRACKVFTPRAMDTVLVFHGFSVEKVAASGYYPLPMPLARSLSD